MVRPDYREIYHYGMPRRSGRYKWGSGDRPYQSLGGKIGSGAKKAYEKAKPIVKNAAKIGVRVAADAAISLALGKVGSTLVYEAMKPRTGPGEYTADQFFDQIAKDVDAANAAKRAGVIISATTLSSIGRMRVNNKRIEQQKKKKEHYMTLEEANKFFDLMDKAEELEKEGKTEQADKLYTEAFKLQNGS